MCLFRKRFVPLLFFAAAIACESPPMMPGGNPSHPEARAEGPPRAMHVARGAIAGTSATSKYRMTLGAGGKL